LGVGKHLGKNTPKYRNPRISGGFEGMYIYE
jgi:hypothetical protein